MSTQSATQAVRRTPLHAVHCAAGAVWETDERGWELAASFGDEEAELAAARKGLAFHDASHVTKVEIAGRETGEFLAAEISPDAREQPYDRALESGEMTLFRLAPQRFLLTAPAAARDGLLERLDSAARGRPNVHVVDQTAGFGCIHLLGPRACQALRKITQLDLNEGAFAVGSFLQGSVAHARAWLHRTREGINLYVSWNLTVYLWETLLDAGHEFGSRPLGTRARDRLGLEKGDGS